MTATNGSARLWRHKSVRALVRSAGGGDPVEIIRTKSREVVAWAKRRGWNGPPFDPLMLASMRGIRTRKSTDLFSTDAQLTPMDGQQLLLEFNPDRAPGRKNYSISHELIHTFFEDCYEMVHQRKSDRAAFDPQKEVEHLCQVGAAEILMPEEDFALDLARLGFSLNAVSELCRLYEASREAVARRMLALTDQAAALVFFSRRLKPVEKKNARYLNGRPKAKMRILYSVQTPDFAVFLPAHKSVPDESCVNAVIVADEVASGYEDWGVCDSGRWFVEAMALPVPDVTDESSPTAVALVLPDK
jgi:Zn-dependent peptidase ImmA (M78 family)